MTGAAMETVLRRDRLIVAAALALMTGLAWAYVWWLAADMDMGGMDMSGFRMIPAGRGWMMPTTAPWTAMEVGLVFAMWAVMMIGMMMPSAAPMILIYARIGREAARTGKSLPASAYFAAGYLMAWIGFALAATVAQWALERSALLTATMEGASDIVSGAVLIAAGLYQWTPLKDMCLRQCQAPWLFIQRYGGFRPDIGGALALGIRHGGYCIGCCWALMALLFVGGVMNVLWIAAITILVLAEKVIPAGRAISRTAGAALFAGGGWLLAQAL
jgi:predicted metal-binding membrane protein